MSHTPQLGTVEGVVLQPGTVNAVVLWMDYDLTPEHVLSTSPSAGQYKKPYMVGVAVFAVQDTCTISQ